MKHETSFTSAIDTIEAAATILAGIVAGLVLATCAVFVLLWVVF
jgi:hypothetical protein